MSNIENGKSFPSTLTIIQIQEKFNVKPEEIFDIEYIKNIENFDNVFYQKIIELDRAKKRVLFNLIEILA